MSLAALERRLSKLTSVLKAQDPLEFDDAFESASPAWAPMKESSWQRYWERDSLSLIQMLEWQPETFWAVWVRAVRPLNRGSQRMKKRQLLGLGNSSVMHRIVERTMGGGHQVDREADLRSIATSLLLPDALAGLANSRSKGRHDLPAVTAASSFS